MEARWCRLLPAAGGAGALAAVESSVQRRVADRAPDGAWVIAALEELLAHLSFVRHAEEEPRDRHDRDERACFTRYYPLACRRSSRSFGSSPPP